ncbi:MAG: DUF4935 domain-containing protein [Eubacterium sp.]|nr:DUF4935 domain-containing protein [Eubacterium sp.]
MKNTIREFLEPNKSEKKELWDSAVFVFDTNVFLNMYRYSSKTRQSLLNAFDSLDGRVWIPYQVAYEYMKDRCNVIYESVLRYDSFKNEMRKFEEEARKTLRLNHDDVEIQELGRYLGKWLDVNKEKNLLVLNPTQDEILDHILRIFDGKVGRELSEDELESIREEGIKRYDANIPPGYKDVKKKKDENDNNAYGDLVIWTQIIEYAKEKDCGIIYVTHDQKEDWWNIVKGRTIGPRIELRREFFNKVGQKFHMYSMDGFIENFNIMNDVQIDKSAVDEIISLDKTLNRQRDLTLNDKIFKKEETLKKIQKRIDRRKKVLDNIDKKYREEGGELSGNIKVQYENTAQRVKELEEAYNKTQLELQNMRKLSNVR